MNAVILSIGQELITGQTVDTNSAYLAQRLSGLGISTREHWTIGDDQAAIAAALRRAAAVADVVLVSGGLGPTEDDLTRQALADVLGTELVMDAKCLAELEEWFRRRERQMVPANRVQAMVPRGARAIDNRMGTAPGLAARVGAADIYIMPGVPSEMKVMYEEQIAPHLPRLGGVIHHHILHTFGTGESDIGMQIADLMKRDANPLVGTTVAAGMVSIRIITCADTDAEARDKTLAVAAEIRRRLGELVVGEGDATMASAVGELLRTRKQTLTTAESCTGGMVGTMLTGVSGSSDYYLGGVVSYANALKQSLLGVGEDLLGAHGAVSEPVAAAMADACRKRLGSDWAISITGVAGPGGGTEHKPVGLVYIGLAGPLGTEVHRSLFPGARDMIRLRAALSAMNYLRLRLLTQP